MGNYKVTVSESIKIPVRSLLDDMGKIIEETDRPAGYIFLFRSSLEESYLDNNLRKAINMPNTEVELKPFHGVTGKRIELGYEEF